MVPQEIVQKMKAAVHQPLNWADYNSTLVIRNTNCMAHAIGCLIPEARDFSAFNLGELSGNRTLSFGYSSIKEVKCLFRADMKVLELKIEEIPFQGLNSFLENLPELAENEYIVALFATQYRENDIVRDFHFLRYDQDKGWSEKRWGRKISFLENISREWPSNFSDRLVGIFKITR